MTERGATVADVWAGLASSLVVLPSAIAFGAVVFAPLGAEYAASGALAGAIGAIVIGLAAPLVGGTRRLISGPSAPAAAVLSALALRLAAHHVAPERALCIIALSCLVAGWLQLLYGVAGGGRIVKYIPYPVAAGYLAGVGVMIILSQAPNVLVSTQTVAVGTVTIGLTLLAPRVTRRVPASILGLAGGIAAYFALGLFDHRLLALDGNPLLIGPFRAEGGVLSVALERWRWSANLGWDDVQFLVAPALTLSVLLSFDTLKTCVMLDSFGSERHDSDKELRGQGVANVLSALAGGMSGSGQSGATMVNIDSGARTNISSMLNGAFCLAAFALLGGLLAWLPLAALAGVLIVVGFRMIDLKVFSLIKRRATIFDFVVVAAVVGVAVGVNLIAASAVGVGLSILLFMRDLMSASIIRRRISCSELFSKQSRLPAEMTLLELRGSRTLVCELQGSLFFGTTDQLFRELERDIPLRKYVILDLRRVQNLDYTAARVLSQMHARLAERGGALLFSDIPPRVASALDVEPSCVFSELDDALAWTENRLLAEHSLVSRESEPPLEAAQIEFFGDLGREEAAALETCLEKRSFAKGSVIFAQGDDGDELYLIRKGRVRIELPVSTTRGRHVATFSRGDAFGEIAFLDDKKRTADAKAETDTELYVLSRRRLEKDASSVTGELYARLARMLALRLRRADAELRALQAD